MTDLIGDSMLQLYVFLVLAILPSVEDTSSRKPSSSQTGHLQASRHCIHECWRFLGVETEWAVNSFSLQYVAGCPYELNR